MVLGSSRKNSLELVAQCSLMKVNFGLKTRLVNYSLYIVCKYVQTSGKNVCLFATL